MHSLCYLLAADYVIHFIFTVIDTVTNEIYTCTISYRSFNNVFYFVTLQKVGKFISVDLDLSEKNRKIMDDYVKEDIINEALVHFSAKGKCLRECKSKSLPPQLRQPDILLLETFKKRLPYSYLHYSYYQVERTCSYTCMLEC